MATTDYNKLKKLEATSTNDSGSTVDKAQPILIVGGDDSTTGTGDIVLDWTNISSESDIAVYDQNGNLLPYEIESFDATAETATLWCYNSWARDDSVQAQVCYGDGPASSEENVTGTWNNTGQNAVMVQHLQDDPLTATDSTSNNNDGTVNGATATSGQFDGAASFDGTDDVIETSANQAPSELTYITWVDITSSGDFGRIIVERNEFSFISQWDGDSRSGVRATDGSNNYFVQDTDAVVGAGFKHMVGTWDGSNTIKYFEDSNIVGENTNAGLQDNSASIDIGGTGESSLEVVGGTIDEVRVYSEDKSSVTGWIQADYDASPKAGQVFFSQQAAESTVQTQEKTFTQDVSLKDFDRTKQASQDLILENPNVPEQFSQDVALKETDQTATFNNDTAVADLDVEQTFTQDVTIKDFDAERTFNQDVSVKAADQAAQFSQDVLITPANEETFSQDIVLKEFDRTKQFSQDLIIEDKNNPNTFTQTVAVKDKDREAGFQQDTTIADLDNQVTFAQDTVVSIRGEKTFTQDVIIAKQPAPDVTNPLTVNIQSPSTTYVKNLNPSKTMVKVKDIDL